MKKSQTTADLTLSIRVPRGPLEVYDAIVRARDWWIGEFEGESQAVGDSFTYRYRPYHRSVQQVVELVPGRRVVWKVLEAELPFVKDPGEWKGTTVVFEIADKGGESEVRFTHVGLTPKLECYGNCAGGWRHYVETSLPSLILTGRGVDPEF